MKFRVPSMAFCECIGKISKVLKECEKGFSAKAVSQIFERGPGENFMENKLSPGIFSVPIQLVVMGFYVLCELECVECQN